MALKGRLRSKVKAAPKKSNPFRAKAKNGAGIKKTARAGMTKKNGAISKLRKRGNAMVKSGARSFAGGLTSFIGKAKLKKASKLEKAKRPALKATLAKKRRAKAARAKLKSK